MSKEATNDEVLKVALKKVIEKAREYVYLPEYRASIPDSEILGVVVSKYFDWEGRKIAEVTYSGLEDANYHKFSEKFNELWKSANKDQDDLWEIKN